MPAKGFLLFEFELKLNTPTLSTILSLYLYLSNILSILFESDIYVVTLFFLLLPVSDDIIVCYFNLYGIFSISKSTCYKRYYDQIDDIFNLSLPAISLLIFNYALLIAYAFGTYFFIRFASWSSCSIWVHFGQFSRTSLSHYNF